MDGDPGRFVPFCGRAQRLNDEEEYSGRAPPARPDGLARRRSLAPHPSTASTEPYDPDAVVLLDDDDAGVDGPVDDAGVDGPVGETSPAMLSEMVAHIDGLGTIASAWLEQLPEHKYTNSLRGGVLDFCAEVALALSAAEIETADDDQLITLRCLRAKADYEFLVCAWGHLKERITPFIQATLDAPEDKDTSPDRNTSAAAKKKRTRAQRDAETAGPSTTTKKRSGSRRARTCDPDRPWDSLSEDEADAIDDVDVQVVAKKPSTKLPLVAKKPAARLKAGRD